jgi:hypothetical protein
LYQTDMASGCGRRRGCAYALALALLAAVEVALASAGLRCLNFVLVDGSERFSGLPADVSEAGEILPKLEALFEQVDAAAAAGARASGSGGDHGYHAGNYEAPMAITQACTKMMADGAQCGAKHAYAGPLQSPCREVEGAERG